MLRYLYADQLKHHPKLSHQMFCDRADQFKTRLNWDVTVNACGHERDGYDEINPLYVIWETPQGDHGGSMRFLPTTGPVMVNDHFDHLTQAAQFSSPLVWECTRFCLNRDAPRQVAAGLMLSGFEVMAGFSVRHIVGVFDARMIRIFRKIGHSHQVIGADGTGRDQISVGLWEFDRASQARVAQRAGVSPATSRRWFEQSFPHKTSLPIAKAG